MPSAPPASRSSRTSTRPSTTAPAPRRIASSWRSSGRGSPPPTGGWAGPGYPPGAARNRFFMAVERAGLAAADRVVAVSGYTAEILATRYGVPADRLRVVHNAIDPGQPLARWTVEEGDRLVLFAGRITRQKGPEYFVEAGARVAPAVPSW